jgi:small-conductance mechanosensitive channel
MTTLEGYLAFMDRIVYGNTLKEWVFAGSLTVLVFFAMNVVRRVLRVRLPLLRGVGKFDWEKAGDYVLRSTRASFLFVLSFWIGTQFLKLSASLFGLVEKALVLAFLFQAAVWANFLINFVLEGYAARNLNGDADKAGTLKAASGLVKLFVWVALLLFALDNMGVDVTTLIAGLGIGGVAVGLASQKILSDLFSSVTIILDKPFVQGDSIKVGDDAGTIERIGLKTTRVRSASGEELSFPNSDLLQSRIHNFRRMFERRVAMTLGVTYQTKHEKLKAIPGLVESVVSAQKMARFDRAHFAKYGESSLDFEIVYWIRSPDGGVLAEVQHEVNLELFRRFEEAGIEFAYPSRTVYLQKNE